MTVRALIIRPDSAELERIELAADSSGDTHLLALRAALDALLVDLVRLEGERGVGAWVDDEFLFSGAEANVMATNILRAYGADFGSGFVNGAVVFTGDDGRGRMVSLTGDQERVLRESYARRNAVKQHDVPRKVYSAGRADGPTFAP